MIKINRFQQLKEQCQLKDTDFYLLELIPLIEIIWADHKNQQPELNLLYKYTTQHLANLSEAANGEEVISPEIANDFLDRFAHQKPAAETLKALRQFVTESWHDANDSAKKENSKQSILDYCLDIAACCVSSYPYDHHQRIADAEKAFLKEIMTAFHINPEQTASL